MGNIRTRSKLIFLPNQMNILSVFKQQLRFASKKSGGSTSNGRTSNPKFLGFKKLDNSQVKIGNIIKRQRGTVHWPGEGVGMGKDYTLYALRDGLVNISFDLERQRKIVNVGIKEPSKVQVKQRLRDLIDANEYLSKSSLERYEMVMEASKKLSVQLKKEKNEANRDQVLEGGNRKFDLVDLTLI